MVSDKKWIEDEMDIVYTETIQIKTGKRKQNV